MLLRAVLSFNIAKNKDGFKRPDDAKFETNWRASAKPLSGPSAFGNREGRLVLTLGNCELNKKEARLEGETERSEARSAVQRSETVKSAVRSRAEKGEHSGTARNGARLAVVVILRAVRHARIQAGASVKDQRSVKEKKGRQSLPVL
jgi:hypothetical protein